MVILLYKHTKRIVVLEIIFSLFISIIAFKLCYLQICKNNVYLAMASDMWQRSFPLLAPRGYIYDTNMITLASNIPTFSLAFMPYQIKDKYEVASRVGEILGVDRDELYNKINKNISIVRLNGAGRNINDDIARRISLLNLEGVYLLQDSKRYYPYDNMLSNVLGFSGVDNQGLAGIEAYYDNYLKGTNGSLNYYMDAKGGLFSNLESNIVSPVSGLSISLTVDFNIQSILERELNNAYVKYNPSSIMGMVMNPNTGEILAMSNYPNYNPNNYKEYDSYLYNFNLPVWKSYEPGSTFKVFSFAAALNEKKINMYKDTYYDTGSVKVVSPLYIIFSRLHWINTYTVQIVPGIANVFGMFLLRQYMLGIHDSVLESARLDGMGELGIFAKIAFPMSAPAVGAFLILQGLAKWNDFLWPVIFVNDMEYQPLMVLLPLLTTESSSIFATPWTLEMAGCTVATLPIFLLFLLFQDTIMQSVTLGSVKE